VTGRPPRQSLEGPEIARRDLIVGAAGLALVSSGAPSLAQAPAARYGLVGKLTATPGQRDALIRILTAPVGSMPGCLSYVVAEDAVDPDLIWITEAWESREAHRASLALPAVRAAIAAGRPLIAAMEAVAETRPVGGHNLGAASTT